MVSSKEWEGQKKVLLEKRRYLLKKISEKKSTEDSALELGHGDDLDKASASRDLEINYMLSSRERGELKAIDEALRKIEDKDKTYGICDMCGKKISKKRLLALPLTPYCRDCQSEMEMESKEI